MAMGMDHHPGIMAVRRAALALMVALRRQAAILHLLEGTQAASRPWPARRSSWAASWTARLPRSQQWPSLDCARCGRAAWWPRVANLVERFVDNRRRRQHD